MTRTMHFVSGLPRAGSTLLAAILRQNPGVHAAMTSPVGPVFNACLGAMGADNEFALFFSEAQKRDVLRGIFDGYYGHADAAPVVFDTNRMWTSRLSALRLLFPQAKVVCCVRNPAWVLDSVERLVRRNALDVSRLFAAPHERGTVYSRAEALAGRQRMIGFALSALKEAYYGEDADMMLLVDYEILAGRPKETVDLIYDFVGLPRFAHDYGRVEYEAEAFDGQMLAPGLHRVSGPVRLTPRRTILPPDLFEQFERMMFWRDAAETRAHRIVPAAG